MKIKAVEMQRRIRAEIAKETEGMSEEELCAYYEAGSRFLREEEKAWAKKHAPWRVYED